MKTIEDMLSVHPFVQGLSPSHIQLLLEGAAVAHFEEDEFIFHEHDDAGRFYLIVSGNIALKIHAPSAGPIPIQTVGAGQVLGWSWLIPPYKWQFDARAYSPVTAITFDATFLQSLFERDPEIGYRFLLRITLVLAERLQATRLQLLDVYQAATS